MDLSVDVPQEAAALTQGMSGRDLKQLAQSVRAVAYPAEPTQEHFLDAIGAARKSHNTKVDRKAGWETLVLDDAILDRLKLVCALLRDAEKWQAQGVSIPRSPFVGRSIRCGQDAGCPNACQRKRADIYRGPPRPM